MSLIAASLPLGQFPVILQGALAGIGLPYISSSLNFD